MSSYHINHYNRSHNAQPHQKTKNPYIAIRHDGKRFLFNYGVVNGPARIDLNNMLEIPTTPAIARALATIFLGPFNEDGKRKGGLDFKEIDNVRINLEANEFIDRSDVKMHYCTTGLEDCEIEAFALVGTIGLYKFVLRQNVLNGCLILLYSLETDHSKKDNNIISKYDTVTDKTGDIVLAKFKDMIVDRGAKFVNNEIAKVLAKTKYKKA